MQYADYAVWQREWLQRGSAGASRLEYWREQLAGSAAGTGVADGPSATGGAEHLTVRGSSVSCRVS